jgi:hypothetical protein
VESEPEEDTVYLDRHSFFLPESPPSIQRSYTLIHAKKSATYGELMNAGPLPENPYFTYAPHNSFDERGFLREEAHFAKVRYFLVFTSPYFVLLLPVSFCCTVNTSVRTV